MGKRGDIVQKLLEKELTLAKLTRELNKDRKLANKKSKDKAQIYRELKPLVDEGIVETYGEGKEKKHKLSEWARRIIEQIKIEAEKIEEEKEEKSKPDRERWKKIKKRIESENERIRRAGMKDLELFCSRTAFWELDNLWYLLVEKLEKLDESFEPLFRYIFDSVRYADSKKQKEIREKLEKLLFEDTHRGMWSKIRASLDDLLSSEQMLALIKREFKEKVVDQLNGELRDKSIEEVINHPAHALIDWIKNICKECESCREDVEDWVFDLMESDDERIAELAEKLYEQIREIIITGKESPPSPIL